MKMIRTVSRIAKMGFIAAGITFGITACGGGVGGGSNNNQGLSFTLIGVFSAGETSCAGAPVGAIAAPLSSAGSDTGADPFFGAILAGIGLQNNLGGQAFNVDRLDYEFFIPGSSAQPPSTVTALPVLLGPGAEGVSSSLPQDFATLPSCSVATVSVLPQQVRAWIALNRASLPEAPFDMLLTLRAHGEATGGDRLTSNDETIVITVTPDAEIPPSSAGSGDTGTGNEGGGGALT